METERQRFEDWYTLNAFDLPANPIGSRQCDLQWKAWQAAREPTDADVKRLVDRFLGWKLPEDFSPDAGISFKRTFNDHLPVPMKHEPTGTNLFDARQAEAMIRYLAICRQPTPEAAEQKPVAWLIHYDDLGGGPCIYDRYEPIAAALSVNPGLRVEPLYTHPPKPEATEPEWMRHTADLPRDVAGAVDLNTQCERMARNLLQPVEDCFIRLRDKGYAVAAQQVQIAMESDGGAVNKLFHFLKHAPAAQAPKPPAEWMAPAQTMLDAWTQFKNYYEHCGSGSLEAGRAWDLMNRAAKRLEEAKHYTAPAEGWIKCSDRLPEIGEEVQVYCIESVYPEKPRVKALARFIPYEEATTYYWDSAYGGGNRHTQQAVIAWQPLAAAPKS